MNDELISRRIFCIGFIICEVMDEADRILNMDFEAEVDKILKVVPRERKTYLFSATMTKKVAKLQRASLQEPVKVEVSTKYQTVDKLLQYYIFIPLKYKVWETYCNRLHYSKIECKQCLFCRILI